MRHALLVMLALVFQCGYARAWGDEGHKIVCEIAFRLAQPDTRPAVRKLIRSDTEFDFRFHAYSRIIRGGAPPSISSIWPATRRA